MSRPKRIRPQVVVLVGSWLLAFMLAALLNGTTLVVNESAPPSYSGFYPNFALLALFGIIPLSLSVLVQKLEQSTLDAGTLHVWVLTLATSLFVLILGFGYTTVGVPPGM